MSTNFLNYLAADYHPVNHYTGSAIWQNSLNWTFLDVSIFPSRICHRNWKPLKNLANIENRLIPRLKYLFHLTIFGFATFFKLPSGSIFCARILFKICSLSKRDNIKIFRKQWFYTGSTEWRHFIKFLDTALDHVRVWNKMF